MIRLENAQKQGVEEHMEKIVIFLEGCLKQGFEGGHWGYYIPKPLGDLLNKNGISFTTYTDGEFEQSKVWYRKGEVTSEFKND